MTTVFEQRIDEILERKVFPDAKAWCLAAKVSSGYVATLKTRAQEGKAPPVKSGQLQALARAAGVSLAWLTGIDDVVIGEDPLWGELPKAIRMRAGLEDTLSAEPFRWHVHTILRALQYPSAPMRGAVARQKWWRDLLDEIQRSRFEPIAGEGAEVHAANEAQVGPRIPLPQSRARKSR